ncbi:putative neural-cadherin 2, partial [Penaeus japonicus]|uniref:putative neural-cadherin 2 n=1 Tax=Penaeus japonicus TaxID=27405 RepID=UPI001C713BCB
CIDDVRLSGRPVTLAGGERSDRWSQRSQVERGCPVPDLCTNTSCLPPLHCHSSWAHASCSCGPGHHLVGRACRDVDECVYEPCLHGGTCYNLVPGYRCACGPAFEGENCQWTKLPPHAHTFAAPIIISAITLSSFLMDSLRRPDFSQLPRKLFYRRARDLAASKGDAVSFIKMLG